MFKQRVDCCAHGLTVEPVDSAAVLSDVRRAMAEDLGSGDVSAALIDDEPAEAVIICRENAVLCGTAWADACVRSLDSHAELDWYLADGDRVQAGESICRIRASSRALLSAERCMLNFIQTLSATATVTAQYVAAVQGTSARILDTRKTLPGLRKAQKYAVRCGGGHNHRIGLFDAVMLKENHILAAGSLTAAMQAARARFAGLPMIVEVETLAQLHEAISCGFATRILLDNFSLEAMRDAVSIASGHVPLEASGGMDIDGVQAVAGTGVDFISVGALTKHVRAVDLSMRLAAKGS